MLFEVILFTPFTLTMAAMGEQKIMFLLVRYDYVERNFWYMILINGVIYFLEILPEVECLSKQIWVKAVYSKYLGLSFIIYCESHKTKTNRYLLRAYAWQHAKPGQCNSLCIAVFVLYFCSSNSFSSDAYQTQEHPQHQLNHTSYTALLSSGSTKSEFSQSQIDLSERAKQQHVIFLANT